MLLKELCFSVLLFTCITVSNAQNNDAARAQHQLLNMPADPLAGTKKFNPDPLAAWFPKAGLGLFIHWGAISTYGGGDISWCMLANKSWPDDGTVTPNFYYSLMDKWNPQKYNPDEIIKQAKNAGFEYAVLTTKHHDGYTLWPSKYGDLGTQTKLNGRDFVKPFIEACRKYGLKVGLYYSPPDWWFDRKYRSWSYSGSLLDMNHQPIASLPQKPADHDIKRKEMVANQVRELLTNYGKIDLLWFDGGTGEISNDEVRKLQPGIVLNRRNNGAGDYGDSEGKLPENRFNGWFETCDPIWPTRWWSFSTNDTYDEASTVITNLIKLRAWGGNYLANLAPDGDGAVPQPALTAMNEMAIWMKHSKESVADVEGGNYPEVSNVPVTVKNNILYAFALPGYQGTMKIGTSSTPKKVVLLRTGKSLQFKKDGNHLYVEIPPKDRTRMPDALKIIF
ncbi:alpha-L-fucosidase [Pedobacter nutrimenti]|uniref:alpha-L-fucosidase n=1 Tax=Pedobacter nutrimenti TaxID=1241337 RepID=UPI00292D7D77|nr:alpha-L-fucosidase [Pedobacter nutrimenti]